jgi:hypothetical protein
MNKQSQLNVLNRVAALRLGTEVDGYKVEAWYRLSSTGKLEYRRRGNGEWTALSGSIEDAIHAELARAERFGVAA